MTLYGVNVGLNTLLHLCNFVIHDKHVLVTSLKGDRV